MPRLLEDADEFPTLQTQVRRRLVGVDNTAAIWRVAAASVQEHGSRGQGLRLHDMREKFRERFLGAAPSREDLTRLEKEMDLRDPPRHRKKAGAAAAKTSTGAVCGLSQNGYGGTLQGAQTPKAGRKRKTTGPEPK